MRIVGTSIHNALGRTEPLDYSMVQEAVDSHQPEDQGLDWKQSVGEAGDVAADVAAMANARGGLLVYGVRENRATSGAEEVVPVDISDAAMRGFRAKLYARLNPPVPGLVVQPLPVPGHEGGGVGILAVQVPDSPDSPHVVGAKKNLGVPYRVGTQTEWMAEWEIERAYHDRFARRISDSERLDDLIDQLNDHLDMSQGCWIVGATRLTVPIPTAVEPPDREAVVQTVSEAGRLSMRMYSHGPVAVRPLHVAEQRGHALLNPRVGLRRWVMRDRAEQSPEARSDFIHLEIHHDGSIVLAARVGDWYTVSEEKHYVPDDMVVGFAIDFVALLAVLASRRGVGQTLSRLRLVRDGTKPLAIWTEQRAGGGYVIGLHQPPWTTDLNRFLPVDHAFANRPQLGAEEHRAELRATAQLLAADVVSQFGLPPQAVRWPEPGPA